MPKGVWTIKCAVCDKLAAGPPHGTTCFTCLANGVKFCVLCKQIKSCDEFYQRPDSNGLMAHCSDCYKKKRKSVGGHTQEWYARHNKQSADCKHRAYSTEEGRIKEISRCHSRRAAYPAKYTRQEWLLALAFFDNSCAYCSRVKDITVDHILALSKGGANERRNIIPCCSKCNSSKSDTSVTTWFPKQKSYTEERAAKILQWIFLEIEGGYAW